MADKLTREIVIEIVEKGSDKAVTSIKALAKSLENTSTNSKSAASGIKGLDDELQKIIGSAKEAAGALDRMGNNKGLRNLGNSTKDVVDAIEHLTGELQSFRTDFRTTMENMSRQSKTMENNVIRSMEDVGDSMFNMGRRSRRAGSDLDQAARDAARAARGIGDTSGAARGATRDFAALASIAGPLPRLYAMFASNVWVLKQAFEKLKLGDEINKMEDLGRAMGKITGTPTQVLAASLRSATGEAISFENAMKKATKASTLGITATELADLGVVAQRSAAAGFTSMDDALERVIKGVSKMDVASLEGAGIIINLNQAYTDYANKLNAVNGALSLNSQNLTGAQKKQAVMEAVLKKSNDTLGKLDAAINTSPWDRFGANIDGATSKMQQFISSALEPTIEDLNRLMYAGNKMKTFSNNFKGLADNVRGMDMTKDPDVYIKTTSEAIKQQQELSEAIEKTRKVNKSASEEFAKIQNEHNNLRMQAGTASFLDSGSRGIATVGAEYATLQTKVSDTTKDLNEMNKTIDELDKTMRTLHTQAIGTVMEKMYEFKEVDFGDGVVRSLWQVKDEFKSILPEVASLTETSKAGAESIGAAFRDLSNTNNVVQAQKNIEDQLRSIDILTGLMGDKWIDLASKIGLTEQAVKRLKNQQDLLAEATLVYDYNGSVALKNAQAQYDLAVKTKDAKKVGALAKKQEADLLEREIAYQQKLLKDAQSAGTSTDQFQLRINQLEKQKLDALTSSLTKTGAPKAVKTEKTIKDLTEKINLVNNRTMNDQEYQLAIKKVELNLNKQDMEQYKGKKDKQNEYNQALLNEAQILRDIRALRKSDMMKAADMQASLVDGLFGNKSTSTDLDQIQHEIAQKSIAIQMEVVSSIASGTAMSTEKIRELNNELTIAQDKMDQISKDRIRGFDNTDSNLLSGTYGSTRGMEGDSKDQQEMINNQQGYADALSNLQALNSEATSVATNLGNVMNAVMMYADGALDATSTAAAGMQLLSSVFAYTTKQQTSAIDMAIKAEQERDGKSEESKSKIKKMEAEKLKIQQDAAKKQILIQTAVAVMQAANAVPYPWSIPLMVAAAAAGAMAYSQASNPTSPSMDTGGGDTGYLKLGERDKSIDVSQNANGGELSYLRGEKGVGSAQNFIPRAEGGPTLPGVGYIMGEHGVEVNTPSQSGYITPNDQLSGGNSRGVSNTFHISTMDADSFRDFLAKNKDILTGTVESTLNEGGGSLYRN